MAAVPRLGNTAPPVELSPYELIVPDPDTVAMAALFMATDLPTRTVPPLLTKKPAVVLFETVHSSTAICVVVPSARTPVPFDTKTESVAVPFAPFARARPKLQFATREFVTDTIDPLVPEDGTTEIPVVPMLRTVVLFTTNRPPPDRKS